MEWMQQPEAIALVEAELARGMNDLALAQLLASDAGAWIKLPQAARWLKTVVMRATAEVDRQMASNQLLRSPNWAVYHPVFFQDLMRAGSVMEDLRYLWRQQEQVQRVKVENNGTSVSCTVVFGRAR